MEIFGSFAPVSDVVLEGSGTASDRREKFLGIYVLFLRALMLLLLLTPSPSSPLGLDGGAWSFGLGRRAPRRPVVLWVCESFVAGLEVSAFRCLCFSARLHSLLQC